MLRSLRALIASTAILSSSIAAPAAPLQPVTGKWQLNYGTTQCIASRTYGDPAHPVTLLIVPSPEGQTYQILVARKYGVSERATEEQGTIDFGAGPIKAWVLFYQTSDKSADVHQFRIPAADMAQARSARSVVLRIAGSADFSFELDSMSELLDGLQACTVDLQHYWNMDRQKSGSISKPAHGDLRSVFTSSDYPREAQMRRQQGNGRYLLLVDEQGKIAGCDVLTPTGIPILDAMACVVIQSRAKFSPALDLSGRPIRSALTTPPISWRLEP